MMVILQKYFYREEQTTKNLYFVKNRQSWGYLPRVVSTTTKVQPKFTQNANKKVTIEMLETIPMLFKQTGRQQK
jgi:hypothetical protein